MTADPTDPELTHAGLAASGQGRILLLACGALARELLDLIRANGWTHLDLQCLPAILHNRPQDIPDRVAEAVEANRAAYDQIFVVYADCGTGGQLARRCQELGVEMVPGPHCYSFLEGNDRFAARDEISAFYLTDFLVRQFDAFVWRPLGLDKYPDLRDMYFGNYTKLVYQAQTDDPALTAMAQDCATRLGLPFERRFVGYGDLPALLSGLANRPVY
ncbi:MAG: DUF1638 domain-containing protein [Pseudomonadota bacterium]